MRQVMLQVPFGSGEAVGEAATGMGAVTLTRTTGNDGAGARVELLLMTLPNAAVGPVLEHARQHGSIEACVPAAGAFAFEPPAGEISDELLDVTRRSPLEVVLAGRQAVGGWLAFLLFAASAGGVAWLGLTTGTVYLLTGSMLIAPFAGPAMNTAIALASGRPGLLRHALVRYVVGILVTASTCVALTLLLGPTQVPPLMLSVLTLRSVAVLLPLVAGVAGATFLVSSEHSSLISGAAVGVLVAASLAPPAAALGIAVAIGRWDLATDAGFVVALQLAGITTTAVVALWLYGVRAGGGLATGDDRRLVGIGLAVAAAATVALVALQLTGPPVLRRGSQVQAAVAAASEVVDAHPDAILLDVGAGIGPGDASPPRLLVTAVVEARDAAAAPDLRRELVDAITDRLDDQLEDALPRVRVDVLSP